MYYQWRPYVSVAERRRKALRQMDRLRKKGTTIQPVEINGRKIARTFWGEAWCNHMEACGDFENRLPRGRTYVRNGSVCHLAIEKGRITACVSGSEVYDVDITLKPLHKSRWSRIKQQCAGQIASLLDLIQGKLSDGVMRIVTDPKSGLFPDPAEFTMECSCPDWASMCKHIAAVMYGVGARLDSEPHMLFVLRGCDHEELISAPAERGIAKVTGRRRGGAKLVDGDLSSVFGIELDTEVAARSSSMPKSVGATVNGSRRRKPPKSAGSNQQLRSRAAPNARKASRSTDEAVADSQILPAKRPRSTRKSANSEVAGASTRGRFKKNASKKTGSASSKRRVVKSSKKS